MTVADNLQDIIADVSAAIAGRKVFQRTELEVLRRGLEAIRVDVGRTIRGEETLRATLDELCAGVERGVVDIAGLARRGRDRLGEVA